MDEPKKNSLTELMKALSCPDREVNAAEFRAFWSELEDTEKQYYLYAKI